jgi:type II secretory pathway component PulF
MFPPLMVHMIASGEATGTLNQMPARMSSNNARVSLFRSYSIDIPKA